jgi:hypothetical protein
MYLHELASSSNMASINGSLHAFGGMIAHVNHRTRVESIDSSFHAFKNNDFQNASSD